VRVPFAAAASLSHVSVSPPWSEAGPTHLPTKGQCAAALTIGKQQSVALLTCKAGSDHVGLVASAKHDEALSAGARVNLRAEAPPGNVKGTRQSWSSGWRRGVRLRRTSMLRMASGRDSEMCGRVRNAGPTGLVGLPQPCCCCLTAALAAASARSASSLSRATRKRSTWRTDASSVPTPLALRCMRAPPTTVSGVRWHLQWLVRYRHHTE
jgi:hypothetical protein